MELANTIKGEIEKIYLGGNNFYGFSVVEARSNGFEDLIYKVNDGGINIIDDLSFKYRENELGISKLLGRYDMLRGSYRLGCNVEEHRETNKASNFDAKKWLLETVSSLNLELTPENEVKISKYNFIKSDNKKYRSDLRKSVKDELKKYESYFESIHNFPPKKLDKEPLRPLYTFYKKLCEEKMVEPGLKVEELKKRKMTLREKLEKYQHDFEKENNRKILYHKDLLPVELEYNEYKSIKNEIRKLETEEN
ncbi:hypothetical protein RS030_101661 [Cryptosporidium xiaoi]|uniref:FAM13A-like domain-containing protein n=1 Tax=Cryptosporidium xiaoi TaxID=659607 RepID=A0AAV9Y3M1_9CRYT